MTSTMLANRLCRNLTVKDVTRLPMVEAARVVDAMNEGVKEWYDNAPPRRMQSPQASYIRVPVVINVTVTNGSKSFSYTGGTPFPISGSYQAENDIIGMSALVTGDTAINRINRSLEFLRPFTGSTGATSMTVYCDAVQFDHGHSKIIGDPIFRSAGITNDRPLIKGDEFDFVWRMKMEIGFPRWWWTSAHNPTDHLDSPIWLMRMWPLPTSAGTITYNLENTPDWFTYESIVTPVTIPIPPDDMSLVIRLCEERLLNSPIWDKTIDRQLTLKLSAQARAALEDNWTPTDTGPCVVGTPRNF